MNDINGKFLKLPVYIENKKTSNSRMERIQFEIYEQYIENLHSYIRDIVPLYNGTELNKKEDTEKSKKVTNGNFFFFFFFKFIFIYYCNIK